LGALKELIVKMKIISTNHWPWYQDAPEPWGYVSIRNPNSSRALETDSDSSFIFIKVYGRRTSGTGPVAHVYSFNAPSSNVSKTVIYLGETVQPWFLRGKCWNDHQNNDIRIS
jgi:hypothetical protein